MRHKPRLSDFEKGQILAHKSNFWPIKRIAEELGRSKDFITAFVRDENAYNREIMGVKSSIRLLLVTSTTKKGGLPGGKSNFFEVGDMFACSSGVIWVQQQCRK